LPLEELTSLEKLFLAHNKVGDISPLGKLKKLTVLDLLDNDIYHEESAILALTQLSKLRELSIGSNPVNAKGIFKHQIILKLNLVRLEDDKVTELDKDIAKMYYVQTGIPLPEVKLKPLVKRNTNHLNYLYRNEKTCQRY
jgi:Leucine-rich repeat (LRR) protein